MKRIICTLAITFIALVVVWAAVPTEIIKTVSLTTVPEKLGTDVKARIFIFVGNKSARATNTSRVWIQLNPTNDVGAFPLQPGQLIAVEVDNTRARFVDWWIDVETAGDGVTCLLIQ